MAIVGGRNSNLMLQGDSQMDTSRLIRSLCAYVFGTLVLVSHTLPTFAAYTQVIAFGDSLSDNGNLYSASYGLVPTYPYWQGRFSNGEVGVEYLASELGVPLTNYAYGGATSGTNNYVSIAYGFSGLPGVSQEVSGYVSSLGGGTADNQALFVLWAGANDFFTYGDYQSTYYPGAVPN
jgi:phospholipase/lecithinase/hemolysin